MKIVVLVKNLAIGGAEKQAVILSNLLSANHQIFLLLIQDVINPKLKNLIDSENVVMLTFHGNIVQKLFKIYKAFKKIDPDIIFSYLLTANFIGSILGWLAGVPHRIGGIRNSNLNPKKVVLERFLHNHFSTQTIFNNYSGAKLYADQGFDQSKFTVIPNCAIKKNTIPSFRPISDDKVRIITVGRFVEQKDFFTAIDSIEYLVKNGYLNLRYTIIGYGHLEKEIVKRIIEKNLSKYISVIVSPLDLDLYYQKSDVYLCTSLFEGISNTILEAMMHGLPIIATDVGDNRYLVKNDFNGFLVAKQSIIEISRALKTFLSNPKLLIPLGKNSQKIVNDEFGEERMIEAYDKFIENLECGT